jgi:hypothetical protein
MKKPGFTQHLSPLVIGGAIVISVGLCLLMAFLLVVLLPVKPAVGKVVAALTIIPAPSATSTISPEESVITQTPEAQTIGGISVGQYVQISGTGGDGLRLRNGAGRNFDPLFLGFESEVFQVTDGPKLADGLTWWFLTAPYDAKRKGWAAADYLSVVAKP